MACLNITNGQLITRYQYYQLNQLTREDNADLNKTITYTYDAGGNITLKKEYNYTIDAEITAEPLLTIDYTYGNEIWKDQLTAYNGNDITYDEMGNPLTYGSITFSWEVGRQLAGYTDTKGTTETEDDTVISYKYNEAGIRTEKTINGVTTKYYLSGDKVIKETNGTDTIWYSYDTADNLISMNLNGTEYYYKRNAQMDIIGILDGTGAEVVSYKYDSWGNLISITGDLASTVGVINPYRYRGYRYDEETGLYYLQSRYYNPEWGRFVNGDDLNILKLTQGELLSHNLYAYCINDPINKYDPNGDFWFVPYLVWTAPAWIPYLIAAVAAMGTAAILYGSGALERIKNWYYAKTSKTDGKTKSSDVPSWVREKPPKKNEKAKIYTERILNEKYGKSNWKKGPGSEYSKILKWAVRAKELK